MSGTAATKIRIVCISDTHNHGNGEGFRLPAGDVLIHAGDITNQGNIQEFRKAVKWLEEADFKVKIIVAGNRDLALDAQYSIKHESGWKVTSSELAECQSILTEVKGAVYLKHESCTVGVNGVHLRVFGSPYSIDTGRQNWAFQYDPIDADTIWSAVPEDTHILITHSPPIGVLDQSQHWTGGGCPSLWRRVSIVRPVLHVFGHHHEGRGALLADWTDLVQDGSPLITPWQDPGANNRKQSIMSLKCRQEGAQDGQRTAFVNASIMKTSWSKSGSKEFNKPIVVSIDADVLAGR